MKYVFNDSIITMIEKVIYIESFKNLLHTLQNK